VKRSIATIAALAGLLVFASTAAAGEALVDSSAPTTVTTVSTPPSTTSSTPPSTTTSTPPTTTTTTPPTTTDGTPDPCTKDCIPVAEEGCMTGDCVPTGSGGVPTAVGAGYLPFTGIGDVIAPILLALTVLLGGVVAWRWAQLREAVAAAASRARQTPTSTNLRSGYTGATRQLHIEQRARRVFEPRVA